MHPKRKPYRVSVRSCVRRARHIVRLHAVPGRLVTRPTYSSGRFSGYCTIRASHVIILVRLGPRIRGGPLPDRPRARRLYPPQPGLLRTKYNARKAPKTACIYAAIEQRGGAGGGGEGGGALCTYSMHGCKMQYMWNVCNDEVFVAGDPKVAK